MKTIKLIMLALILGSLLLFSNPASSADQWSTCSIYRAGVSAISGYVYIVLTHVSGGTAWEGARSFRVDAEHAKTVLAVALAAQSNQSNVLVQLADTAANSLIWGIYNTSIN